MTGFARAADEQLGYAWAWEVKSVNSRGLEIRCRVPSGFEAVEAGARKAVSERFQRGSFALNLAMSQTPEMAVVQVNWPVLTQLLQAAQRLQSEHGVAQATADGMLGLRGVLDTAPEQPSEQARAERDEVLLTSVDRALADLAANRQAEGARLAQTVTGQLERIRTLTAQAAQCAGARPEAFRQRLEVQLAALLDGVAVSEERLAQEVALLASKIDVQEELDRLLAHAAAAQELIKAGGPLGRRLDFLAQEFNREANTLCAKSQDVELTRIGIELKSVIDQLREQAQNIE